MMADGGSASRGTATGRTEQIDISSAGEVKTPTGEPIKNVREAIYLRGLISCDGKAGNELSRRLGECSHIFNSLQKLWSHTSVGKRRKLYVYSSCVISKLLYSLDTLWLLKADKRRLDSFHCKCVRKILGIRHSYVSRVSNAEVLTQAGERPLSDLLLDRQVKMYGKIAISGSHSLVRKVVCQADGTPKNWAAHRRRGRPRQQWAQEVYKLTQSP